MKTNNTKIIFFKYLFIFSTISAEAPIIIYHDAGVDDIIATTLQILNSPNHIKAITVVPADSYAHPAAYVMEKLKDNFFPSINIPIGISYNAGTNLFPDIWREHSWKLARLNMWENEKDLQSFNLKNVADAITVLKKVLSETTEQVKILMTGPCTNIAKVLQKNPEYNKKIERAFIMGGAVYVKGNVEEKGHDGSAEWNIYNNPKAFQEILKSGIPVTLIPLDATQYTPIRKEFMSKITQYANLKQFRFLLESLTTIQPVIDSGEYLFWDTLTSAALINPDIIKTKKVKINVILYGNSMGRTFEDPNGFEVDVALWANQELFEKTVFDVFLNKI